MATLTLYQKQINNVLATVVALVTQVISLAIQQKKPVPYHTSILTGQGWVMELLEGHPKCIQNELGVHKPIFRILIAKLQNTGFHPTRNISSEEQLAIFLHACVTGLSVHHIGERFQHSNDTIAKYNSILTSLSVADASSVGISSRFSECFLCWQSIGNMFSSPMPVIQHQTLSLKTHASGHISQMQ